MANQETLKPASGLYTCLSCQVAFEAADTQRLHYRSDWHRYNLKRKVASLPPVAEEQFRKKSEAIQEAADTNAAKEEEQKDYCTACRKPFNSKNAYTSHLQSKKHKENEVAAINKPQPAKDNKVAKLKQPDMRITDETTEEEIDALIEEKVKSSQRLEEADCLFCDEKSATFEDNMKHMTVSHSFFIPDIEYLTDMRGLIRYLGEKLSIGNVCLYCNGKGRGFRSLEAVRAHMFDMGHCMIAYDEDEDAAEFVDFYDFSSSHPQTEGDEEVDPDTELAELTNRVHLADDHMSLVLPNGNVIGHRSLKRFYDQNLKPADTRDSVLINKLIGHYTQSDAFESLRTPGNRQLLVTDGRRGTIRTKDAFKDKRIHEDYRTRVGIQSNKLQKYFREQIL